MAFRVWKRWKVPRAPVAAHARATEAAPTPPDPARAECCGRRGAGCRVPAMRAARKPPPEPRPRARMMSVGHGRPCRPRRSGSPRSSDQGAPHDHAALPRPARIAPHRTGNRRRTTPRRAGLPGLRPGVHVLRPVWPCRSIRTVRPIDGGS
nr:hypothetical protein RVX_3015 [Nitratidesulfovibrio sp. HK-II]